MDRDREILKQMKAINAIQSVGDTGEKWVDKNGQIYNIDRKPIDWALIIEKEQGK